MGSRNKSVAYLDNNATTLMPEDVVRAMVSWANQGNPSASYPSAEHCKKMMDEFRALIAQCAGCPLNKFRCIFTSGATESNCMIIQSVIRRVRCSHEREFHVVASAVEHKSILLMLEDLMRDMPEMSVTYVNADFSGHIGAEDIRRALRPTTRLVICMNANNETGAIMNIAEIGRVVKAFNPLIFFHSDIVQSFGKIPVNLDKSLVDGASISFHKLHGPPGVGAAIIRLSEMQGLCPILYGTQSYGMRGGTENVVGIGAAFEATRLVFARYAQTVQRELALKTHLINRLSSLSPLAYFSDYIAAKRKLELQIVIIGDNTILEPARYLPGTIMLAVAKHVGPHACNTLIKEKLQEERVIVSVGSACSTKSTKPSHVLTAMGVTSLVADGAIRVSMCGYTTQEEVDRFIEGFLRETIRQRDITEEEKAQKK